MKELGFVCFGNSEVVSGDGFQRERERRGEREREKAKRGKIGFGVDGFLYMSQFRGN